MIKVEGFIYNYKLKEPISISFHTWHYNENVIVKLSYNGLYGFGESASVLDITGDSQVEVINELKKIEYLDINPLESDFESFHEYLKSLKIKSQTLYAAFDFAYHDLIGKLRKLPVHRLYQNNVNYTPLSVTVFLKDSIEKTKNEAIRITNLYPHLKVMKIKLKGVDDIERCQAIKEVVNRNLEFTLDANQGFEEPEKAVKNINAICQILGKVKLVEEPCPKGDLDKLKYVKNNVKNTLIFADESAVDLEDALQIIKNRAAHGINIKLQKTGGIWPAKKIAETCQESGLKVMLGAMAEGPLAIAAGVNFAACTNNVILSDLDMDLDLELHTNLIVPFVNGTRMPIEAPGLGIEFNVEKIKILEEKGILKFERI